jgi:hypothetical protein
MGEGYRTDYLLGPDPDRLDRDNARKHVQQMYNAAWLNGCPHLATRIAARERDLVRVLTLDETPDERLNGIATLLWAFWNHPAPSTRAQIEEFIVRNVEGVTVQQLRECDLSNQGTPK